MTDDTADERLTFLPYDGAEPVDLTPFVLKASPMTSEQLDCPCGCQDRPAPTTWSGELTFTIGLDTTTYERALRELLGHLDAWLDLSCRIGGPPPLAIDGAAYARRRRARARRKAHRR